MRSLLLIEVTSQVGFSMDNRRFAFQWPDGTPGGGEIRVVALLSSGRLAALLLMVGFVALALLAAL
jgi:hypothetical protein